MDYLILLPVAIAPGLFWLWYFYKRDEYEPEPLALLAQLFFLGMVAALIAGAVEILAGKFITGILFFVLAVPVIEECSKFFLVLVFAYRDNEFDEPMDGIVYATAAALGFATLENLEYLTSLPSDASLLIIGTLRAVLTVPAHALFGIFWGYGLGIAKFSPLKARAAIIITGLVLGICVHSLFNFLLDQSYTGFAVLLLIILPLAWWVTEKRIRNALLGADPAS